MNRSWPRSPPSPSGISLVALEGFSEPDAARVLDTDVMKLRGLVEEIGCELGG